MCWARLPRGRDVSVVERRPSDGRLLLLLDVLLRVLLGVVRRQRRPRDRVAVAKDAVAVAVLS